MYKYTPNTYLKPALASLDIETNIRSHPKKIPAANVAPGFVQDRDITPPPSPSSSPHPSL